MGHELYNHSYKFVTGGKDWLNERTTFVKGVEDTTRANYRGGLPKDSPNNVKPKP